jgi:hypothetical protein
VAKSQAGSAVKVICKFLLLALNSRVSLVALVVFCGLSFCAGQKHHDMNLFAASGAVMTVCGLLSLIRFTTIEKYLNQDAIASRSTGVTGPPLNPAQLEKIKSQNVATARARLTAELKSELTGIALTITGTLIWAYGSYVPLL